MRWTASWQGELRDARTQHPRDPLGLASDAPLLDGWLRFSAAIDAGTMVPFTILGHKQRTHLVGDVVRGDVPLRA
jgi:lysine decarboxylase